jgi:hypothetical protein
MAFIRETEENREYPQFGWLVFWLRFKRGTCCIKSEALLLEPACSVQSQFAESHSAVSIT